MTSMSSAQWRKGVVEYCILGLLHQQPSYGWALSETLTARGVIASIGTLYPAIKRLKDGGLIALAPGAGRRRTYEITARGELALAGFAAEWSTFATSVSECVEPPNPKDRKVKGLR